MMSEISKKIVLLAEKIEENYEPTAALAGEMYKIDDVVLYVGPFKYSDGSKYYSLEYKGVELIVYKDSFEIGLEHPTDVLDLDEWLVEIEGKIKEKDKSEVEDIKDTVTINGHKYKLVKE